MSEDVEMDESLMEPLQEMSQDCIVEWNEVHPVSDIQLATTPINESPSHGVSGLDEVRRKLEDGKIDRREDEINAILNLLQNDNRGGVPPGESPSAVATQRTKNPRQDDSIPIRPKSKKSSLASRCRRQRQPVPPLLSNKRHCRAEPDVDDPPCRTPPPPIKGGAFDSLLKQLKHSPHRSTPQSTLDKEIASHIVASPPLMEDAQGVTDTCNAWTSIAQSSPQGITKDGSSSATKEPMLHLNHPPLSNAAQIKDEKRKIPPKEIASQSTASNFKDEEDEFGSFPFDQVDMSCLDQLLSIQSSQQPLVIPPEPSSKFMGNATTDSVVESSKPLPVQVSVPQNVLRDKVNKKLIPAAQEKKSALVVGVRQQPIVEDEFGEFPDLDFDEIEQAIANREQRHDPLQQEIIQNPRNDTVNTSGLSFIKFSRYKVLKIEQDSIQFRKTLQLAEWTHKMAREYDEMGKIHRNSIVETVSETSEKVKPVHLIPRNINYPTAGCLQLRGQWYYTAVEEGDEIHICSLTGQYRTDASALPLVLHSHPPVGSDHDDLVIIHHPDLLMTPTVVSETVSCPRRAVLKQRNGSTGLTSKSALIGTLRHALFGCCMKEQSFEKQFVVRQAKKIVRENAETMLGCGVTTQEAEKQLIDTLPVILAFVNDHTTLLAPQRATSFPTSFVHGHIGGKTGVRFAAHSTYSIEEPVISPELALNGYVDAVLETTTASPGNENDRFQQTINGLKHSLMALELKTGHNQTSQHTHMGQLSLYSLMLQCRYGAQINSNEIRTKSPPTSNRKPDPRGAASGGLLLYLNHESFKATHVAPAFDEFKSLIGQRNVIAAEYLKSSRPRGVFLRYEEEKSSDEEIDQKITLLDTAPPVELPDVQQSEHSCTRCFENRSCMLYARSEIEWKDAYGVGQSHRELLKKFTGHLRRDDIEYFRKWDRLIDLEAHATMSNIATAWLVDSREREKKTGETISSLVYDGAAPSVQGSGALLRFRRAADSVNDNNLDTLSIGKGSHVVLSTDGCVFDDSQSDPKLEYLNTQSERKKFRHHMHIVRGFLEEATSNEVVVSAKREDLDRIREMCSRFKKQPGGDGGTLLTFRLDKDSTSVGVGTLRQNLINLFTADHASSSNAELTKLDVSRQRRLPRLRGFVVRLDAPTFVSMDDESMFRALGPLLPGCDVAALSQEFQALNDDQQNAIRKVMSANDYTLIQGLPGTGKTSTLAFIARLLAARGKRVLITSYTNTAVDNVVMKLLDSGVGAVNGDSGLPSIVRVGPRHSCHEIARTVHVSDLAVNFENTLSVNDPAMLLSQSTTNQLPRAESLQHVMSEARIVCSTVLTVPRSPFLVNESFDVVIVDEAGQTSQPAILGALMLADAFVLVGDHKQLPPLVTSEIALAGGYGESLLMRLAEAHPSSVAPLTYQYRMNEEICKLSSYLIYGGKLKCGSEEVRQRKLHLPGFPTTLPPVVSQTKGYWPWLKMAVSPEFPVIFVDTDNLRKTASTNSPEKVFEGLEETKGGRAGGRITNPTEATLVRYVLHGLVSTGASPKDIGVISPFRAQVQHLDEDCNLTEWKKAGLEISTIDRYQGRDKAAIILSFVRSNAEGNTGRLLQDKRRLNVALTRAKSKLIMIGSFSTLKSGSAPLRPLLGRINSKGQRQLLPENALECYPFPK